MYDKYEIGKVIIAVNEKISFDEIEFYISIALENIEYEKIEIIRQCCRPNLSLRQADHQDRGHDHCLRRPHLHAHRQGKKTDAYHYRRA